MLVILAALNDEIRLIRSEMALDKAIHFRPFAIFIGRYQGRDISLVRTGVGKKAMKAAISYCIKNLKPSLLMNIGYAGGIDPHLHPGDIIIATSIVDEPTERAWDIDEKLTEKTVAVSEAAGLLHHTGKIVTVDKPLTDPHQKAFTGTRFEAAACDMESAAFAKAASEAGIPFLVARAILDPLDTTLPEIPEEVINGGKLRFGRLIGHLKSNPKDILKLPRFSYLCSQARISMTNFVKEWSRHEQEM